MTSSPIDHAFLLTAVGACAAATTIDIRTGNIPNWLTLGLLFVAPAAHAAIAFDRHHHSWTAAAVAFGGSLGSGIAAALLPLALARSGGLGLGDVKLFAAIGAACGIFVSLYAQTYAYVFAMLYALTFMALRGRLRATFDNVRSLLAATRANAQPKAERHQDFTEMKFAPAIFAGMFVAAWARWRA